MKFTSRQMQLGVLALGVALILFGGANAFFDFKLDPKLENDISNYILIAAALLFIYSRQLRTKENLAAKAQEEAEQAALESKPADAEDTENSGDDSKS